MKKMIWLYLSFIILSVFVGLFILNFFESRRLRVVEIRFSENPDFLIFAELAKTMAQQARGLMFRESLGEKSGMLFVFLEERRRTFWMKNTKISLDLIFLSADKKIIDIKSDMAACDDDNCAVYSSAKPAKFVLEINSGLAKKWNLKEGDKLDFSIE